MNEPPLNDRKPIGNDELRQRIERQILLGTWGRIHNLRVEVTDDGVFVRGVTPSFYIKQLVLQAVFDLLGTADEIAVKFDIQVGASVPHRLQGSDDLWGVSRD